MLLSTPIETPRLILRQLELADVTERYAAWLNDEEVIRHLELRLGGVQTVDGICQFVEAIIHSADSLMLAICLKEPDGSCGLHIGNVKIGPIMRYHRRAEIGFLIGDRSYWGKGYAVEAVSAMSEYGLTVLGLHKITAGCYADNLGSARTLLRCGFFHEATLNGHWVSGGARVDGHLFGKWRHV